MSFRLFLKSAVFVLMGLAVALALSVVVRFEIGRLLFAICLGGVCLIAELYVLIKIAQHLWKWSDRLTSGILRSDAATATELMGETERRGEA